MEGNKKGIPVHVIEMGTRKGWTLLVFSPIISCTVYSFTTAGNRHVMCIFITCVLKEDAISYHHFTSRCSIHSVNVTLLNECV